MGGTERTAIRLANAWTRRGCRVILYVGEAAGAQRELVGAGVEIRAPGRPVVRGPLSRLRLGRWFGRCCASDGLDAVFVPGNFYFSTIGDVLAATRGTVPVYAKISNSLWRPDRSVLRNRFFSMLTRWRLRHVTGLVAMSSGLAQEARRLLGSEARLTVVPEPVLEALPPPTDDGRRRWHLCAVGRLAPQKNFALLLRSLARLGDLPVTLDIAGDGEQREMLQQLARTLGVADRVRFLGTVSDVLQRLAQAEVMVLTSDFEGYPAVIVEALSVGTFVVARDCSPAIGEVLTSAGMGCVVAGADPGRFAAAVRGYLGNRTRDTQRMRDIAATHLVEEVASRYLALFGFGAEPSGGTHAA